MSFKSLRTLGVLLILALSTTPVYAEGPGTGGRKIRLDGEPAGGYLVRAVTSPTPPTVNNLYLEVRLTNATTGEIITDGTIWIKAFSGADIVEVQATHDIAPIPDEYAAHLLIPFAEVWEIQIKIDGPLGNAEVAFLERVSNPNSLGAIISIGAPVVGLLILGILFYWLRPKSLEEPKEAPPSPE